MRNIPLLSTLAAALFAFSTPAHAWWEYAKWGMTAQQLATASKGAARPCEGSTECSPPIGKSSPSMIAKDVRAADLPAKALFDFDDQGRLRATLIVFGSKAIIKVNEALAAAYGAPASIENSWPATRLWRDPAKGTTIKSWSFPDSNTILVEYRPIAKGL